MWLNRVLSGGTYTPGTNWASQFDGAAQLGVIKSNYSYVTSPDPGEGSSVRFMVYFLNGCDQQINIGAATVGAPCQVVIGNTIAGEYTAPGPQTIFHPQGMYPVDVTRVGAIDYRGGISDNPTTGSVGTTPGFIAGTGTTAGTGP